MSESKKVDQYILKKDSWTKELELIRKSFMGLGLEEFLKWGAPVYVDNGKNVVGLAAFKNYVGIWYFQGALLKDENKKLYNAQEGKTTALRQWRFQNFDEIVENLGLIERYTKEAIQNFRDGKVIKPAKKKPLVIPVELEEVLAEDAKLKATFEALNLTKKREFTTYISTAKRDETKQRRLKKIIPMIQEGIGLGDKYRK